MVPSGGGDDADASVLKRHPYRVFLTKLSHCVSKVPALVQAATHSCNYSDENKNTKGAQPVHLKGT